MLPKDKSVQQEAAARRATLAAELQHWAMKRTGGLMADIRFDCPQCSQSLDAPPDMAGELIDCPRCKTPIEVPHRSKSVPLSAEATTTLAEGQRTRKCPFCAEQILADALKCRFCGEFLDARAKAPAPLPTPEPPQNVVVKGKGEGCFLQTLNAGCVVVIVAIGLLVLGLGSCFRSFVPTHSSDGGSSVFSVTNKSQRNVSAPVSHGIDSVPRETNVSQNVESEINYEVLRKWREVGNSIGMDILVKESESREDVMRLAERLRKRYDNVGTTINIFDSQQAWRHRDDQGYPEKDYWRHYLVQIDGPKLLWTAEGRDH